MVKISVLAFSLEVFVIKWVEKRGWEDVFPGSLEFHEHVGWD
jgi:hypothetical protein